MKIEYHWVGFTAAQKRELWERWRKGMTNLATKRSPGDGNMNQGYNNGAGAKAAEVLYTGSKR